MMEKRHVVMTGEIGAGKSTALRAALALLGGTAGGLETYCPEARGVLPKRLYMRAFGSVEEGELIAVLPGGDQRGVTALFDSLGVSMLHEAEEKGADVIVIDECGRLEREAHAYHKALRACLDGETPVLMALRMHKAEWADFIREHPAVTLLEVTQENRDGIPQAACALLHPSMRRRSMGKENRSL